MASVKRPGQTSIRAMKETSQKGRNTGKAPSFGLMAAATRANGMKTRCKERAHTYTRMVRSTQGASKLGRNTDKGCSYGLTGRDTKGIMLTTRSKGMGNTFGLMAGATMGSG